MALDQTKAGTARQYKTALAMFATILAVFGAWMLAASPIRDTLTPEVKLHREIEAAGLRSASPEAVEQFLDSRNIGHSGFIDHDPVLKLRQFIAATIPEGKIVQVDGIPYYADIRITFYFDEEKRLRRWEIKDFPVTP